MYRRYGINRLVVLFSFLSSYPVFSHIFCISLVSYLSIVFLKKTTLETYTASNQLVLNGKFNLGIPSVSLSLTVLNMICKVEVNESTYKGAGQHGTAV